MFALNNLTTENMTMLPLGNDTALRALKSNEVDAAVFVDGAQNQAGFFAPAKASSALFARTDNSASCSESGFICSSFW